jgi:pyrimidine nucleoside transport protein
MALTIGTGAVESLNAVACIFLGQTEAAILIGRSLPMLTKSEVHTVMTSGFAGIAGSLFSAYISFGVSIDVFFVFFAVVFLGLKFWD